MKKLNSLLLLLVMVVTMGAFTSCEENNEPVDAATAVAGRYAGELYSGGSMVEERCFVTLERYSSSDIKVILESDNHNLTPVIISVYGSDGDYILSSDSYSVSGKVTNNILNLYYTTSDDYAYSFSGKKQ